MKKLRLLILISLIICCLSAACACSGLPKLAAPSGLQVDMTTLSLGWDEIAGARMYTISITDGDGVETEAVSGKNSYPLDDLAEGKYVIKVKANGKEDESEDSPWSASLTFTREHETGLSFTPINGGTEYSVSGKGIATADIVIPGTYRGKPVTAIGDKAFFNKSDISSVVIGENVRTIGSFAFANCSYVTSITLPEGLLEIGESAFASCRLLSGEIVIPDGVTEIPKNAFAYCARISGVRFGSGLEVIRENAFTDCKSLESLEITDGISFIGEYAFASCEGLRSVQIGKGMESISPFTFSGAVSLGSIAIPDTLKTIGESAFFGCLSLSDVTVGSGIEAIDIDAFRNTYLWNNSPTNEVYVGGWFLGCTDNSVSSIGFREDTVGIANYALCGFESLVTVILPDSTVYIGDSSFAYSSVKNVVIGAGVRIIGANAFLSCENLSTVILGSYDYQTLVESSLEVIENYAFRDCAALNDIQKIPDTVKMIGAYAFRGTGIYNSAEGGLVYADGWLVDHTEELTGAVIVDKGTVGIANYAFYECKELTSIRLPDSIKTVGRAAFYDCSELSSVTLPDTLEVIDDYTFYRCYALRLFELPKSLKIIGRSAFYKCATVYYVGEVEGDEDIFVIPDSVEHIGDYAFYASGLYVPADPEEGTAEATYGVDILVIGSGVKTIGESAFYGFASLKHLTVGDGVEMIGNKAFYNCRKLESVVFGKALKSVGDKAFYKCESLGEILLPEGTETVGNYAFYKCAAAKRLVLGGNIASIGSFAFFGCEGITEVYLPATLTALGRQAFRNCKGLTQVILASNITEIGSHAFYGCNLMTVYAEPAQIPEGWHKNWNSSYRPVVWGCNLSEDKDYVISIEKREGSIVNRNSLNTLTALERDGFTFVGWDTNSAAEVPAYTAQTLPDAPNGRRLYAIWSEDVQVSE